MPTFDLSAILNALLVIAGGSVGTWFCTELIKKAKSIPWIQSGDTAKIRAVVSILGALSAILGGWASGTLDAITVQDSIQAVIMAVGVIAGAHFTHKTVTADKTQPPV